MPSSADSTTGHAASRLPAWMLALGVTFVAYYGLLLFSDLTRPQPLGLRLEVGPAGAVVRAVAPDSLAAQAGLAAGDRVLGANGHPIRSRLDWMAAEMNLRK